MKRITCQCGRFLRIDVVGKPYCTECDDMDASEAPNENWRRPMPAPRFTSFDQIRAFMARGPR